MTKKFQSDKLPAEPRPTTDAPRPDQVRKIDEYRNGQDAGLTVSERVPAPSKPPKRA